MNINGDFYVIKSISMANHLIRSGNDLCGVSKNDKNDRFYVFLFKNTSKLRNDMFSYDK